MPLRIWVSLFKMDINTNLIEALTALNNTAL